LVKSVSTTKQSDENTRQSLKRFSSTFDKQRREEERSFAQLDDRTKNIEISLVELNHNIDSGQRLNKTVKNEMLQVKSQLDNLFGAQRASSSGDGVSGPRDLQGRLGKIEDQVNKLDKSFISDKAQTLTIVHTLGDAITKNSEDQALSKADMEAVDKAAKLIGHRLTNAEKRDSELSLRQDQMKDLIGKNSSDLRSYIAQVQKDTETKLTESAHELGRTNVGLMHTGQRLDTTNMGMQSLQGELNATNSTVGQLSVSLDLAHEYFQGVTKGFQDTHKRVIAGQDGMLPPKGGVAPRFYGAGATKTLPVISAPRPSF